MAFQIRSKDRRIHPAGQPTQPGKYVGYNASNIFIDTAGKPVWWKRAVSLFTFSGITISASSCVSGWASTVTSNFPASIAFSRSSWIAIWLPEPYAASHRPSAFAASKRVWPASLKPMLAEQSSTTLGYDVLNDEYTDMLGRGIVDPAKVTRSAVENASSIAGMILTTEALISDKPEKEMPMPAMPGGGMDF